jgi:hypothetical protein
MKKEILGKISFFYPNLPGKSKYIGFASFGNSTPGVLILSCCKHSPLETHHDARQSVVQ